MKKAIAILMALVMLCTLSSAAFAETETVVTYEDVKEIIESTDGEFMQIADTNLKIWIPAFFHETELTEEDEEAGIFSYMFSEAEDAAVWFTAYDAEGTTLQELQEELVKEHPDTEITDINGIEALGSVFEEDDAMCVYFMLDTGYLVGVNFAPISDMDYFAYFSVMIYSIQTIDE